MQFPGCRINFFVFCLSLLGKEGGKWFLGEETLPKKKSPVKYYRIHRSNYGGFVGHFEPDQAVKLRRIERSFWAGSGNNTKRILKNVLLRVHWQS
jgi:hypothetical protein